MRAELDPPVDEAVSKRMKQVGREDTAPELIVRKLLFSLGYRYRLHRRDLPGTPDIVLPGQRKLIFVHGCFWHGHSGCPRASLPRTRNRYWHQKIEKNKERDLRSIALLQQLGWSAYVIWECETRNLPELSRKLRSFLDC